MEHADREFTDRAERLHACERDVFLESERLYLLENFLAAVEANEQRVTEFSVIHRFSSLHRVSPCPLTVPRPPRYVKSLPK